MKKSTLNFSAILMFLFMGTYVMAQMPAAITIDPPDATAFDELTLTIDAKISCPDSALFGADSVMIHSGVELNGEAWQLVVDFDAFGVNGQSAKLTSNGDSTWSITYVPADYYGFGDTAVVTAITCVFNAGDWSLGEGKDFDENGDCTDFIIPLNSVGIFESSEVSFNMFPNPVGSILTIEKLNGADRIEIYNIVGSKVKTIENIKTNSLQVNTSDLKTGVYFINVHSQNEVQTAKFLKD